MNTKDDILNKLPLHAHHPVSPEFIHKDNVKEAMESYALSYHSHQSVSGAQVEDGFKEYMYKARKEFCYAVSKSIGSNYLSTAIDSFLICFDQMRERLSSSSVSDAVEFFKWFQNTEWITPVDNPHNFIYENDLTGERKSIEELYQLFLNRPEPPKK